MASWLETIFGARVVEAPAQLTAVEYRSGELGEEDRALVQQQVDERADRKFDDVEPYGAGLGVVGLGAAIFGGLFVGAAVEATLGAALSAAIGIAIMVFGGGGAVALTLAAENAVWSAYWNRVTKEELRRAEPEKRAADQALMRAKLAEDPLEWPSWTLCEQYPLLNADARAALSAAAGEIECGAVLIDAELSGNEMVPVSELLDAVRARGVARVDCVTLRVPVQGVSQSNAQQLATRHQQLSQEYGAYLSDPREVLRRPALSDVTDPLTAEFVEAYANLTALGPESDAYEPALTRAWKAWRSADRSARRLGLKGLTPEARKRVRTAQKLLELALDPSASDAERASAYAQVSKLVAGLVVLPEEARVMLEGGRRALLV